MPKNPHPTLNSFSFGSKSERNLMKGKSKNICISGHRII